MSTPPITAQINGAQPSIQQPNSESPIPVNFAAIILGSANLAQVHPINFSAIELSTSEFSGSGAGQLDHESPEMEDDDTDVESDSEFQELIAEFPKNSNSPNPSSPVDDGDEENLLEEPTDDAVLLDAPFFRSLKHAEAPICPETRANTPVND